MNTFKIIPLTETYAGKIRSTGYDDFGNKVIEQVATGYGPCRVSLKPFRVGHDKRLLFAHSPFTLKNAFNQPGPVFIHGKDVAAYADINKFPPEIKADKINFPLTLIGYNTQQEMIYSRLVGDADVDELINEIFTDYPEVDFLHARNAEAGCYICKIERA